MLSGTAPNLVYTPSADDHGPDGFTYQVSDGTLTSAAATVSITVISANRAPVASGGSGTTLEDTAVAVVLTGSDPDGDALVYTVVQGPTKGALSGTAPNLVYTPSLNDHGSDGFTFTVSDGTLISAPATVSITITPVNDAPEAIWATYTLKQDSSVGFVFQGTDVDSSSLTYAVTRSPSNGSVRQKGQSSNYTYTPKKGFSGEDYLEFTASDGSLRSVPARVTFVVQSSSSATKSGEVTVAMVTVGDTVELAEVSEDVARVKSIESRNGSEGLAVASRVGMVPAMDGGQGRVVSEAAAEDSGRWWIQEPPAHGVLEVTGTGALAYRHDGSGELLDALSYWERDVVDGEWVERRVLVRVLQVLGVARNGGDVEVEFPVWQGVTFFLERSTGEPSGFGSRWELLTGFEADQDGVATVTDTGMAGSRGWYRVRVREGEGDREWTTEPVGYDAGGRDVGEQKAES
jgi:hypothetical protein